MLIRRISCFILVCSLSSSTVTYAQVSPEAIIQGVETAIKIAEQLVSLVGDIRRATREAGFLRTNKPLVDIVEYTGNNGQQYYGMLNMKPMSSFVGDFYLWPKNETDINKMRGIVASANPTDIELLNSLANNNCFKNNGCRAALGYNENLGQNHAVVMGKGTELAFSGFPNMDKFTVDFILLDTFAAQLASASANVDTMNQAAKTTINEVLAQYKDNLEENYFATKSADGRATVKVYWPNIVAKKIAANSN